MEYSNILIIKMSSLGDVLHTLPFVAVLRERFPGARITWLVHPQFAAFVPEPPLVDEILYFDKVKFKKMSWGEKWAYFKELRGQLRSRTFDLVIDLQGLFKSAVLAAATGCGNRIGYCEMREGSGLISRAIVGPHANDHVIERYLDVARYLGARAETIDFPMPDLTREWQAVREKLRRRIPSPAGAGFLPGEGAPGSAAAEWPYVVCVPGARWETKKWPAENYAALAKKILAEGKAVILAGGPEDVELGCRIRQLNPAVTDLTGQTSLRELAALIQHCTVYISADTGPLFIAAALKKPLIALYGPTRPDRTGPYGSRDAVVLTAPVPCAGCLKKQCGHWVCMNSLTPEKVYEEYKKKAGEGCGTES